MCFSLSRLSHVVERFWRHFRHRSVTLLGHPASTSRNFLSIITFDPCSEWPPDRVKSCASTRAISSWTPNTKGVMLYLELPRNNSTRDRGTSNYYSLSLPWCFNVVSRWIQTLRLSHQPLERTISCLLPLWWKMAGMKWNSIRETTYEARVSSCIEIKQYLNFRGNFRDISASVCLHFWWVGDTFTDESLNLFTFALFDYVGRWGPKLKGVGTIFGGKHIYFRTFAKLANGWV